MKDRFYLDARGFPMPLDWQEADTRMDWVTPLQQNYTQSERPYSYSEFFVFRTKDVRPAGPGDFHARGSKGVEAAYSDRLSQWDHDAFERGLAACSSDRRMTYWSRRDASDFLTGYFGKPTTAVALAEGCNVGNGYPYWIFWYRHEGEG